MYFVGSAQSTDIRELQTKRPEIFRQVRRSNLPVQLAIAAAADVAELADNPSTAMLVSVAPCQSGSVELYRWGQSMVPAHGGDRFRDIRMNPTHTLHAVDNLALSLFAILKQNHAYCLGLGGSAGQSWSALEAIHERFLISDLAEAIFLTGDQEFGEGSSTGIGVAMLFSREERRNDQCDRTIRIVGIGRSRMSRQVSVDPHSSKGIVEFLSIMEQCALKPGWFTYEVPMLHTDGVDVITVTTEVLKK
jgi:hypothetical protein